VVVESSSQHIDRVARASSAQEAAHAELVAKLEKARQQPSANGDAGGTV